MAERSGWPPRRVLRLLAFLGACLLLFFTLYFGVPYGLYEVGIGNLYRVGTLRSGSGAYRMRFNVVPDALRERTHTMRWKRMAWAFARGGEVFRVDAEAAPRLGGITLTFDEFLGGGVDPVWRHRFDSTEAVRDSVTVPQTGLYMLRFSFDDFVGDARVRWRVEGGR